MGFSLSKALHIHKLSHKLGFNWGNLVTRNWRKMLNRYPGVNDAASFQHVNNAYGVANDYKLNTRYRSLADLTGTK